MKHFFLTSLILTLLILLFPFSQKVVSCEEQIELNTSYCVLIEPKSKQVIYSCNPHQKLYPASMTKMMGMLLILEAIEEKKVNYDDMVTCSEYASSMGGTQIFLEPGEVMKLEDLFKAVAINSANDAIVCLGEYLEGSNDAFVKKMNQKAKSLGMKDTNFKNAMGFDDKDHYTSPYDMAILACHLLKYEREVLQFTSLKEDYIRKDSSSPFWLVNTNKLLGHYEGLDGLKTGFTQDAGYNLTATAKRNGVRLVSVVMNEETIQKRSQDTCKLLDYGFSKLKSEIIFDAGDVISSYKIKNSLDSEMGIKVLDNVSIIMDKEETKDDLKMELVINNVEPPIKENDIVGYLKVTTSKGREYCFDAFSTCEIRKLTFGQMFKNNINLIFR